MTSLMISALAVVVSFSGIAVTLSLHAVAQQLTRIADKMK